MSTQDEFLEQLRATFRVEAAEHLQAIAAGLLELERAPALGHVALDAPRDLLR